MGRGWRVEGGEGPRGPSLRPLCIHASNLQLTEEAGRGSLTTCEAGTRRGGRLGSKVSGSAEQSAGLEEPRLLMTVDVG